MASSNLTLTDSSSSRIRKKGLVSFWFKGPLLAWWETWSSTDVCKSESKEEEERENSSIHRHTHFDWAGTPVLTIPQVFIHTYIHTYIHKSFKRRMKENQSKWDVSVCKGTCGQDLSFIAGVHMAEGENELNTGCPLTSTPEPWNMLK